MTQTQVDAVYSRGAIIQFNYDSKWGITSSSLSTGYRLNDGFWHSVSLIARENSAVVVIDEDEGAQFKINYQFQLRTGDSYYFGGRKVTVLSLVSVTSRTRLIIVYLKPNTEIEYNASYQSLDVVFALIFFFLAFSCERHTPYLFMSAIISPFYLRGQPWLSHKLDLKHVYLYSAPLYGELVTIIVCTRKIRMFVLSFSVHMK